MQTSFKGTLVFKHFLVPTDGSPASRKAAKAGIALARRAPRRKGHCLLGARRAACDLHRTLCIQTAGLQQFRQARAVVQKRVAEIGKMAKPTGVQFISVMAEAFTPVRGSSLPGKKRKCDMICMASHGRRGLSKPIMSSVIQKVLSQLRAAGGGVPLTCVGLCSHFWL